METGEKIYKGGEFAVYEYGKNHVLKTPRRLWLMDLAFGNFRQKNISDLEFLQEHFADFLPPTQIINTGKSWAIRQQRIEGKRFFENPQMTTHARLLFVQAVSTFQQTHMIPDLLNPGNLLIENNTGRLYLVDTSVLGRRKSWPIGFLFTRFLGKVLFDTLKRRIKSGF